MTRTRPTTRRLVSGLLLLLITAVASSSTAGALPPPLQPKPDWPQVDPVASYNITVTLDPQTHTLSGHEIITYHNRSGSNLQELVFHLYLNAFRSNDTLFMRESSQAHRGFQAADQHPGWIQVDTIQIVSNLGQMQVQDPLDLLPNTVVSETLMTTILPQPLGPGQVVTLSLDFHAQLPQVFARTGFAGDFYMVGQWFPKLSVYRPEKGWNAHPFHANSEFFADFGTYDVTITVPGDYVVGATGLPAGHIHHPDGSTSHDYHAEAVIDFVWTAWPLFQEARRQVGSTEILLLYDPAHQNLVQRYLDAAELALSSYSDWYGPYPYPRLTVVDVPTAASAAGGMEYPTLVTAGTMLSLPLPPWVEQAFPSVAGDRGLELVVYHEIAHQWWQSTVATNEFEEPWLDEGLAEYSGIRLLEQNYGQEGPLFQLGTFRLGALDMDRLQYLLSNPDTPMYGAAWEFSWIDYGAAAYYKPAMAWTTLERVLGPERWLSVLRTYNERYRFQHPTTEDLLAVVAEVAGDDVRTYLEPLVYQVGSVDYAVSGLACREKNGLQHCEVDLRRLGEIALPVEVEMTFADGSQVRETWDGRGDSMHYVYDKMVPLDSAQVDPEGKIYLDASFRNNSLTRQVQAGPVLRISSQWLYFMQQLLLSLGGLW